MGYGRVGCSSPLPFAAEVGKLAKAMVPSSIGCFGNTTERENVMSSMNMPYSGVRKLIVKVVIFSLAGMVLLVCGQNLGRRAPRLQADGNSISLNQGEMFGATLTWDDYGPNP